MRSALLLAVAVVLLAAGCGGGSSSESTTTAADTVPVRVYFLRDGKVWPVHREIERGTLRNRSIYEQLRLGPTDPEEELGLSTQVMDEGTSPSRAALAQIVYSLSQSSPNDPVEVEGKSYTRKDFEAETPLILVESPLAFEHVTTPLVVKGTANTFEATFDYELKDSTGQVVDSNFVTATSGTGTRGTFDFTTKKVEDTGSLVVFERSAENGARIHEMEIPLGEDD